MRGGFYKMTDREQNMQKTNGIETGQSTNANLSERE